MNQTGQDQSPDHPQVDLTNCDREPIHALGAVQSFAGLIAMSPDWLITHASENCAEVLGLSSPVVLGVPLVEFLPEDVAHTLRTRLQIGHVEDRHVRVFGIDLMNDGRAFDVSIHKVDRTFILEFELKAPETTVQDLGLIQSLVAGVSAQNTLEGRCKVAARSLRALCGFDRVMVYRFNADDTGTVIAESVAAGMEPYLGLRYPASDIPKQARALYMRSPLRLIADVDAAVSAIYPARDPSGNILDLSLAVSRAVSPIHLEYLRNMGVRASMSVSIIKDGKLWGLMACHHRAPRHIDFELRTMVELFGQLFTYELARFEADAERDQAILSREMHDRLLARMSRLGQLGDNIDSIAAEIGDVIAFDGIAIFNDGEYVAMGAAPTAEEFIGMSRFLNTAASSSVFATECLSKVWPDGDVLADRVSGVLALPISRNPRDYIVLFRREVVQSVAWAGNPDKPVVAGPNGNRLTPRASFAVWKELLRGHATPWSAGELRAAEALRVTLLEVVLRLTDEAARERARATERQELLIAELNHRVRNILNLIRGLVSQSEGSAPSLEEYTAVLGERIHALARAHDQLTQSNWGAASLKSLFDVELKAFAGPDLGRLSIDGTDVGLTPTAFSTMALVAHELMTNSVKYGALSVPTGVVALTFERDGRGELVMCWTERGGPAVTAPTREGFGTTVIERSIPFELGGKADVAFAVTGLQATFTIPARHLAEITASKAVETKSPALAVVGTPAIEGEFLLVEDNLIIAMDTADTLEDFGASTVHTAASNEQALKILETVRPVAAILDVNLGSETSHPVAMRLQGQAIPFILVTGYGADSAILENFPNAPVLKKPYDPEEIRLALTEILRDQ